MAELCRDCFIKIWKPSEWEIDHIVMSRDETMCESCMKWGKYVDHIKPGDISDEESFEYAEKHRQELEEWLRLAGGCFVRGRDYGQQESGEYDSYFSEET